MNGGMNLGLGLGLGFIQQRPALASYTFTNAEAEALVGRMSSQPNSTRKGHVDALVGALKTAGVWTKLDVLLVYAAHSEQAALLNWLGADYNATNDGATFTPDRGFADNETGLVLSSFNPTTAASPNYVQDSAHLGVWSRTVGQMTGSSLVMGSGALIVCRNTSDQAQFRVNQSLPSVSTGVTDGSGHFIGVRADSATNAAYRNGSAISVNNRSSVTPSDELLVAPATLAGCEIAAVHVGSALTSIEAADCYTAFNSYMVAVGAA